jgi:V8-like Glu-specific endopeptidase
MIDRGQGGIGSCTGTFLAPNLILTARHCVSNTQEGIACRADGTSLAGGKINSNKSPSDIYVVTGVKRPNQPEAQGQGAKLIFVDEAKNLCNNDIALVVLKNPVPDAKILPVRLNTPAVVGETFTAIGWGVTEKTQDPATRMQRTGIPVQTVGSDAKVQSGPNEFEVGESICSGDSGGPAVAETTGAVIGVVSRGGNGTQPTQNPASSCTGANASNIYTGLAGFKDLILSAYAEAGQDPWIEGEPDPRLAKDGEACTEATACRSNACISGKCTPSCAKSECAAGTTCQDSGGAKVCLAPAAGSTDPGATTTTTTTGCSSAAGPGGVDTSLMGGIFAALALVASGRRKRRERE